MAGVSSGAALAGCGCGDPQAWACPVASGRSCCAVAAAWARGGGKRRALRAPGREDEISEKTPLTASVLFTGNCPLIVLKVKEGSLVQPQSRFTELVCGSRTLNFAKLSRPTFGCVPPCCGRGVGIGKMGSVSLTSSISRVSFGSFQHTVKIRLT